MKHGLVDWRALKKNVQAMFQKYGLHISPDKKMSELSMTEKQLVEIMKAVSSKARVIIMDEPTSSLGADNVEVLFNIIRKIKAEESVSVVFISHRMEEMQQLCDRVTCSEMVHWSAEFDREHFDVNQIVSKMVGRDMEDFYSKKDIPKGAVVFSMNEVTSDILQKRVFRR